jgi:two-component SAPR family response regulator
MRVQGSVRLLFTEVKKSYSSVRRKLFFTAYLFNPVYQIKQVRLIKACLNEIYSKAREGNYLPDAFSI